MIADKYKSIGSIFESAAAGTELDLGILDMHYLHN